MAQAETIAAFLADRRLALVGASRGGKAFGNVLLAELQGKGFEVFPVHPDVTAIGGVACLPSLAALPAGTENLVVAVPPARSEGLVQAAAQAGIRRIWFQRGAASPEAIRAAESQGLSVVHDECILMFADPRGIHRFHRWLRRRFGRRPA